MGDEWNNGYGRGKFRGKSNNYYGKQGSNRNNRTDGYQKRDWTNYNADLVFYIPQRHVGKIIGRGGCKVKELQSESGARINIRQSGPGDAALTIAGTTHAQQKAKELIERLVNDDDSHNYQQNYSSSTSYSDSRRDNYSQQQQQSLPAAEPAEPTVQYDQSQMGSSKSRQDESDPLDFSDFDWTKANEEQQKFVKERWSKLKPLQKYFYNEDPTVAKMTPEEVAEIRKCKNNIDCRRVFENNDEAQEEFYIPNLVQTFDQAFHQYPEILEQIRKQGFTEPSPIQCQAWPILLSGKDLIGIAQTGTGKTLAFLLPALIHIDGQLTPREERVGPNVLVMAPTRELALQIHKEVQKYEYRGIKSVCVYGGGSRRDQVDKVGKGVNIVVATPGRLNDLVGENILSVEEVSFLVLDEADRMLDMGFEPEIRRTLIDVRPDRQTVMTSATWPEGVRRLAQSYMNDPIHVTVGSLNLATVHTVRQTILFPDPDDKMSILNDFLNNMAEDDKVIVFFKKKSQVDDIASELAMNGINAQSIHGGREQADREQALEDLKSGGVKILLATDIASRGIDIEDVTHVFNYEFPRDIEEYVHRVGRTGRAGRFGESISLFTRGHWGLAKELIQILEESSQEIPDELYKLAEQYECYKERKKIERFDAGIGHYGGRGGRGGGFRGSRGNKNNFGLGYY